MYEAISKLPTPFSTSKSFSPTGKKVSVNPRYKAEVSGKGRRFGGVVIFTGPLQTYYIEIINILSKCFFSIIILLIFGIII